MSNIQTITPPRRPRFGSPPREYSKTYMDDLVRQLASLINQLDNVGRQKAVALLLTGLQTTGYDLRVGEVFNAGGFLKIVQEGEAHVQGSSLTGAVGTVTVTTV